MKKQPISLEEKRKIQLDMLEEVDTFCRKHDIRYSLGYGTLIGAIRHKGFIPWDDDMDIIMPLPDMIKFKSEFQSENVRYVDVDTQELYGYAHSKLAHKHTYSKSGVAVKSHGVDIDLYPILGLPETKSGVNDFFERGRKIMRKRLWINKWRGRIIRRFPLKTFPLYKKYQRKYRDFLFQYPYGVSPYYFSYGGGLHWRNVFDFDLFENGVVEVPFENKKFLVIKKYHEFLTHFYGDYMTPPPVEKQVPYHGGKFYWIEHSEK